MPPTPPTAPILAAILVVAVAALLDAAAGPAAAEALTNKTILRNFNIVAFGNEYTHRRYQHVRKWKTPLRIGIQGKAHPAWFEDQVTDQIADLAKLTGHPIELYYSFAKQKAKKLGPEFDPKKVNVILFYLPSDKIPAAVAKYFDNDPAEVEKMIRFSTCFARYGTKANEIKWAVVVFPAHHPKATLRACVVEELTQILGLASNSAQVSPSIFNDKSLEFELTEHDRWMVRMFYDKRITAGMERKQALKTGWKILNEIRPE